jgi:hypothetical protein
LAIEGTLSTEELRTHNATQRTEFSDEELGDLEAFGIVLRTLQLVPPDFDLQQLVFEDYADNIGGLYFPAADRLVLIAGDAEISLAEELVLAHEYTHSLQDGAFDLEKLGKEWTGSDLEEDGFAQYTETLECLIEGDATFTARLYAEQAYGADWRDKVDAESAKGSEGEEPELPEFLRRAASFNYGDCEAFIEKLFQEGGWEAVNAAYSDPPATTEQVLDIEKYRSRELANTAPPRDLSSQLDGWKLLDSAQFGAYDVYNYALTLTQDVQAAVTAAFGWGAGWINIYRLETDPNQVIAQMFFGWDSDQDLLEFLVAYDMIVGKLGAQSQSLEPGKFEWSTSAQYGHIARHPNLAAVEIIIAPNKETVALVLD